MKKISLNSIVYVLLHVVLTIVVFVIAVDVFIIINDIIGNDELVEKIEDKVDKMFTYGSK